jgi:hypothetical protein
MRSCSDLSRYMTGHEKHNLLCNQTWGTCSHHLHRLRSENYFMDEDFPFRSSMMERYLLTLCNFILTLMPLRHQQE